MENKIWDLAGEVATKIALQVVEDIKAGRIDIDEPVYAQDWGQEEIYNAIMYHKS